MNNKQEVRNIAYDILNFIKRQPEGVHLDRVYEWASDTKVNTNAAIQYMLTQGMAIITADKKLKHLPKA